MSEFYPGRQPVSSFFRYAHCYDLLYRDKDYAAEVEYVVSTIRAVVPKAHAILEFGAGTGVHGRLLAVRGFAVRGIERSAEMVLAVHSLRRYGGTPFPPGGSFTCVVNDIRTARVVRGTFDAVIALFHVMSYQTKDEDLQAAFCVAADRLKPGGVFLFDVWHGPAVLAQRPSERVKEVADERYRVRRTACPQLDTRSGTVNVVYRMEWEDRASGKTERFTEEHLMRYLDPAEVNRFARNAGLHLLKTEEFLTGAPPSPATWGVAYLFQKGSLAPPAGKGSGWA